MGKYPTDAEMDEFAENVADLMAHDGLTERQAVELLTLGDIYSPAPTD